jgi:hypothetical protein
MPEAVSCASSTHRNGDGDVCALAVRGLARSAISVGTPGSEDAADAVSVRLALYVMGSDSGEHRLGLPIATTSWSYPARAAPNYILCEPAHTPNDHRGLW